MNPFNVFIISCAAVGGLSIICYTTAYIMTNPTIIKAFMLTLREMQASNVRQEDGR